VSVDPDPRASLASVRQVFDTLAPTYDSPATRFFPFCADRLVAFVRPAPGTRVLDVATGTGAVAVPFAQAIGSHGRVQAIDISPAMLDRAEANIRKMALDNVDLHEMDAGRLDFRSDYFHSVVCSYGLFFVPDMHGALREWVRVLRPGGKLAFTSFETSAFQPMLGDLLERLRDAGAEPLDGPGAAARIESLEHCRELLADAGLENIATQSVQVGYHLRDEQDWWEVVQSTAVRFMFEPLPPEQREELQRQHLAFVAQQKTEDGLWLDVQTRFACGSKPLQ
jgi:ubiquinone/menaquinone biosynthesis C-methylase UbiE